MNSADGSVRAEFLVLLTSILRPQNILYLRLLQKVFTTKNIFLYAAAMAAILLLLQWMQFSLLVIDHATEIYSTGIAVIFTFLGIWLAKKLTRPKQN